MNYFRLSRERCGLLVVDMQEKILSQVGRSSELVQSIQTAICGFQILQLPIIVTEQYPKGLGETVCALTACLGKEQTYFSKTTFSCLENTEIRSHLFSLPVEQWIVVGIEAHICVLQTVRDLIGAGKQVAVMNEATSSRNLFDLSSALFEMQDLGARVTSVETVLFELLGSSDAPEFKQISLLVR